MIDNLSAVELTPKQFKRFSKLLYGLCGINLQVGKEELVKSRLLKRLRALQLEDFDAYLKHLEAPEGEQEFFTLIDCITTNKTNFFREPEHFEYLEKAILPSLAGRKLRIWSAGCSSGEEPYSLSIRLHEALPEIESWDIKILATDISTRVLSKAREGVYGAEILKEVPGVLLSKYFECIEARQPRQYALKPSVRRFISFARLNLLEEWPMQGPFDAIFCRNVMIYFDKPTQQRLVARYTALLGPGGHLFVGHSESLTGLEHGLAYIRPAVYRKS